MTLLLAAENIFNAKSRWRQVTDHAVWKYAQIARCYMSWYTILYHNSLANRDIAVRLQLRSSAGVLESIIWCFRTRVAPFELDTNNPDSLRPEARISPF